MAGHRRIVIDNVGDGHARIAFADDEGTLAHTAISSTLASAPSRTRGAWAPIKRKDTLDRGPAHGRPRLMQRRRRLSWRAQLAHALHRPKQSEDVTLVWGSILDHVASSVPASRPTRSASDLAVAEAAILARGSADLTISAQTTARAIGRTAALWADLVRTSITTAAAAQLLGVQESRIRQRLADHTLYGFKHDGTWRLPRMQFDDNGAIPGLGIVFPRLSRTINPLAVSAWFTQPTMELIQSGQPVSPRDWLRSGEDPAVVADLAALL